MDDFLSTRSKVNAPRQGQVQAHAGSGSVLRELKAEVRTAGGKTDPSRAPQVETVVVNGRIRRIHLHCKCGEEIILHCDYPQ